MTKKILTLIVVAVLGSLMISSCSSSLTAATSWPGVTVDAENEMVYLSAGSQVFAISTKDGDAVWTYPGAPQSGGGLFGGLFGESDPTRGATFFAPPALVGDLVVVGDYKSTVHAFEKEDGDSAWFFQEPKDKFVGQAAFANDRVFVPSADYHIYALDLDGDLEFSIKTEKSNWAGVVTDGETVYAPSMDHNVYAFDATTGDEVWTTDVDGAIAASPALEDGILYIATLNKEALAIDTADGSILWRADVEDFTWAAPTVIDDVVVVVNASGGVFVINKTEGFVEWDADTKGEVTAAAVAIGDGFIVASHEMEITVFDLAEQAKKRTFDVNLDSETGTTPSTPVVVGDLILIPVAQSTDALLVAFDIEGVQQWEFYPED